MAVYKWYTRAVGWEWQYVAGIKNNYSFCRGIVSPSTPTEYSALHLLQQV